MLTESLLSMSIICFAFSIISQAIEVPMACRKAVARKVRLEDPATSFEEAFFPKFEVDLIFSKTFLLLSATFAASGICLHLIQVL